MEKLDQTERKRTPTQSNYKQAIPGSVELGHPAKSENSESSVTVTSGEPERAAWGNQIEFILTLVGYAVGLGNIWRFPYLCYRNGGGAFLIPYFGTLALVGLPLFFMELAFGQFASLGPIAAWTINPLFKGLGYSMVIINTLIGIYYNIIIAWAIHYFFSSMTSHVPWEGCNNWWNTDNCVTTADFQSMNGTNNTFVRDNKTITVLPKDMKTPSEEYFYNRVLQISDGIDEMGTIVWQLALCLLLSWTIVFFVLIKGISSLGKVVYFSTIFPYLMLTVMLIRGVTLDGALDGIIYYLKPDFSRLSDARAWSDAATQIFFSLSTCTGGLMAMASYSPFKNNCLRDAILVPIINCATSFYGGFAIFSVLGYMAHSKGVSVSEVAASGPGLVFVVFPEALSNMPIAPLWSILFFIMMMTLGLSSEFSIVECFFTSVLDEFPSLRKTRRRTIAFRIAGCVIFYLLGLFMITNGGFYLFNIVDFYVGGFPLLIVGFVECIALCYIYGYQNFADDIEMMLGQRPTIYIRVCWCLVSPLILFGIIVFMAVQYSTPTLFSGAYKYPRWADIIGILIILACVILIPLWFIAKFLHGGGWQLMKASMKPSEKWGPANPIDRIGKYARSSESDKNGISMAVSSMSTTFDPIAKVNVDADIHTSKLPVDETSKTGRLMTSHVIDVTPPPFYERKTTASDNDAFEEDDATTSGSSNGDERSDSMYGDVRF